MNKKEQRIIAMPVPQRTQFTVRVTLAVIDAAYKGLLEGDRNKRVLAFVDTPFAHYYGEPEISLFDRFITDTSQLTTTTGKLNMLRLIEIAGGYVSKTYYGGFTPKGIKYGHIRNHHAFSILTGVVERYEIAEPVGGTVVESLDYQLEEHEQYVAGGW